METKLTERDRLWLALAPFAAAAVLAWMWTAPLCREMLAAEKTHASLGSEEMQRDRILAAQVAVRDAQRKLDETRAEIESAERDDGEVLPPAVPPGAAERFRTLTGLCRDAGLQILKSGRTDANRSGSLQAAGLPVDDASEYWSCKLRGTMEQVADLLRRLRDTPTTILAARGVWTASATLRMTSSVMLSSDLIAPPPRQHGHSR